MPEGTPGPDAAAGGPDVGSPAALASGLLAALAVERAACTALAACCADLVAALQTGRAEPVAAVVEEQQRALHRWREAAEARDREARVLGARLREPEGDLAAALRRAGAEAAADEVARAWRGLLASADDVRRALARGRVLLQQARAFTAFALRSLAALRGGDTSSGYTREGAWPGAGVPVVMDRRG